MAEATQLSWTPEELLKVQSISDAQISSDGSLIAYTMRDRFKEPDKSPRSQIWLVNTNTREISAFTQGEASAHTPRWSPDGSTIAFLSNRNDSAKFEIYTIPLGGGEASRVVELPNGSSNISWSPDGSALAFLMTDPETEDEKKRKENHEDHIEFEQNPKYQRLWVVGADGSDLRKIECGDVQIWEYAWQPSGEGFAVIGSNLPYEWDWYSTWLATVPLAGGEPDIIYRGTRQIATPVPSPNGKHIAFFEGTWSDRGVVAGEVFVVSTEGTDARSLTANLLASLSWIGWQGEDSMVALGYEDGEGAIFNLSLNGKTETLWKAEASFADRAQARASLATDGATLALIMEGHAHPQEVYKVKLASTGEPQVVQLTTLGEKLAERKDWSTQTIHWRGNDDLSLQGVLLTPGKAAPTTPLPLVTMVHGGPTGLYQHSFATSYSYAPLLLAEGYAVFLPNPRGSTGWGTEYAEANLGDMGGRDFHDVLLGIDKVIDMGIADPDRLAICGGSYGGFMTAWAVTQTQRFKAALMLAGIGNWRSFHGVTNIPTWDRLYYNNDDPYRLNTKFDRFSPVLYAHDVTTPTLIVHGENDPCVPVGQAYEFFRALKENEVPTELLVYPREGHGLTERAHILHMQQRTIQWFRKYLQKAGKP